MGKKKMMLRQPVKENLNYIGGGAKLGKRSSVEVVSSVSKSKQVEDSSKATKKMKNNKRDDSDEADWDEIERRANDDADENSANSQSGDSGDDSNSDSGDSDDEIKLQGNVEHISEDYTFEFNDMRDEYSGGIRTMLRTVMLNPSEAYSVADVITAQKVVGTVVNCEGGDDAFAFATVLPLERCKTFATIGKILEHLSQCVEAAVSKDKHSDLKIMQTALSTSGSACTGVLLYQRYSNLPLPLIGPLHRNLEEDLSWAQQRAADRHRSASSSDDEEDDSAAQSSSSSGSSNDASGVGHATAGAASLSFFAGLTQVLLLCEVGSEAGKAFDLSSARAAHSVLGSSSALVFASFEDEVYLQHASAAALVRVPKGCNTGLADLVAVLVPVAKIRNVVNGICAMLPDA